MEHVDKLPKKNEALSQYFNPNSVSLVFVTHSKSCFKFTATGTRWILLARTIISLTEFFRRDL